jgi:antitoxin YxxD
MNNNAERFLMFEKYVFDNPNGDIWDNKHVFFKINKKDIDEAEDKLGMQLPIELKMFFNNIGYGFVCNGKSYNINRIMSPDEIADYYLGIDTYENDERREYYYDKERLVFFEISAQAFIVIDTKNKNQLGQCPIYFDDLKIANSLEEFLNKMDGEVDYYIK